MSARASRIEESKMPRSSSGVRSRFPDCFCVPCPVTQRVLDIRPIPRFRIQHGNRGAKHAQHHRTKPLRGWRA